MGQDCISVAIWPDGDWCETDEIETMTHKSDDYLIIENIFHDQTPAILDGHGLGHVLEDILLMYLD